MTSWCCLSEQGLCVSPREHLPGAAFVEAAVFADVFVSVCAHACGLGLVIDFVWYWCTVHVFIFNREECGLSASASPAMSYSVTADCYCNFFFLFQKNNITYLTKV